MTTNPLDAPEIVSRLFYPRLAPPGTCSVPNTHDGTFPVEGNIVLGYRLYIPESPACVFVFFHGNGEIAADYDGIVDLYFNTNAALMIVDYRGYGWSTGTPLTTTLLTDAEAVLPILPRILKQIGLDKLPRILKGRSLGSAPAIHLAHNAPDQFQGLVIDSGFADMPTVFRQLQIPVDWSRIADVPVGNAQKMRKIQLPLLVIHGENDRLLPIENGQKLYDASPAKEKTFVPIRGAGHNDLLFFGFHTYFNALAQFIGKIATGS